MSERITLVTGATGFLGSALIPLLCGRDVEVHGFARTSARREHLPAKGIVWHAGDLADPASIGRTVDACLQRALRLRIPLDVIHAGALISYRRRDAAQAQAVNVEGTRALLRALREAKRGSAAPFVGRLCHVSSVVAVGWSQELGRVLDEDSPFPADDLHCHYVSTKRESEQDVLSASSDLDVVVVNPGAIFGVAPVRSNTRRLVEELARRGGVPFAPPGSLSAVGLQDVADGCLRALDAGRSGARYLLVESSWTHLELQAEAAALLGVPPPRRVLPRPLWRTLVAGLGLVDRVSPRSELTPTALRHLGVHYRLSGERARRELDWAPRPFRQILAEVVEALSTS